MPRCKESPLHRRLSSRTAFMREAQRQRSLRETVRKHAVTWHARHMERSKPWIRSRGLSRLLARETNISDLLQFFSDIDSSPWTDLVGFVPQTVEREVLKMNSADLLLVAEDGRRVPIEVKLGHVLSGKQKADYERLLDTSELYLAALSMDRQRLEADSSGCWSFLSLTQVFDAWANVEDQEVRVLARQIVNVLQDWDAQIAAIFYPPAQEGSLSLDVLTQKFLARVVSRRIAVDLRHRGRLTHAGVTSGGGLPLIQAWTPIRNEGKDRCFIAEVRWGDKAAGELRFGVDFDPRPGEAENEEVRRAAYDLAYSMDSQISVEGLLNHLDLSNTRLAGLVAWKKNERPVPKGDWEEVIRSGFGETSSVGRKNDRRAVRPAFWGDGTLRYEAIANVDFGSARGPDITDLLDATLTYLADSQPN